MGLCRFPIIIRPCNGDARIVGRWARKGGEGPCMSYPDFLWLVKTGLCSPAPFLALKFIWPVHPSSEARRRFRIRHPPSEPPLSGFRVSAQSSLAFVSTHPIFRVDWDFVPAGF